MLLDAIKNTPLLRPNGIPMTTNIAIICSKYGFTGLLGILNNDKIQAIFVINADREDIYLGHHQSNFHETVFYARPKPC